jgi:hypothetical protein
MEANLVSVLKLAKVIVLTDSCEVVRESAAKIHMS